MVLFRLEGLFQEVQLDLDDEVYIYHTSRTGLMENYILYEAYKILYKGVPIIKQVGYWSKDLNFLNFVKQDKNSRRSDLRVSIVTWLA